MCWTSRRKRSRWWCTSRFLGGGFGGKQDYDEILAAAWASHVVGRPVKLIQTRESNFATSFPRTPTLHRLRAGLRDGGLDAMAHDIVCGYMGPRFSVGEKFGSDWLQLDADDGSGRDIDQWSIGGSDHWYSIPHHKVRGVNHDATTWAVQASALRTVSNSYNYFVVESFLDEVAHRLGRDPLELRLALLSGEGEKRGIPNAGYPPGTAPTTTWTGCGSPCRGRRTGAGFPTNPPPWGARRGSPTCCASPPARPAGASACRRTTAWASASPPRRSAKARPGSPESPKSRSTPATGEITIRKLTIAMDMGIAINPRNVEHQIKGAALWGASQILSERLTMRDGAFEQSNFDTYLPIRLSQTPEIDVEIVESGHHPSGVGEPSSTVVAPAVANAVFDAVGARMRHMPITPDAVLKAMTQT